MELMLIVWLVSIASTIKMVVSKHLFVIVLTFAILYICSKLNATWFKYMTSLGDLRDGIFRTTSDAVFGNVSIPKGTTLKLDVYSDYSYVTCSALGLHRQRYTNDTIRPAFQQEEEAVRVSIPVLSDKNYKPVAIVLSLMLTLHVLLPSDTTMKYMAGAYLLQTTYESDVVQKGIPLVNKAVLNTLESWAKDTPDLRILIDSTSPTGASLTQEEKKDGK